MQRVTIYAMQGNTRVNTAGVNSQTLVEGSFPGCTVSVFTTGTTNLATIYGDNLNPPTLKANPFTADSTGSGFFYAPNGSRVDIQLSGTGISAPFILAGDVLLDDFSLTTISPPQTVAFSATPQFDLSRADWFVITLTGNVTAPTFPNPSTGSLLILSIIQDAAGAHTWAWPASFTDPPAIALGSNARTELTFKFDGAKWTMLAATGDNTQVPGNLTVAGNTSLVATTIKSVNGLAEVYADQYADVQTAINALPATGGICWATSPNVNKTLGALDAGSNSKPVTLVLGPYTFTFTQITIRQGFNILGAGIVNTLLNNVGLNANPAFIIPQVNNNAITVHWSDFTVNALAGNTSQKGLFADASTLTNAGLELSTFTNVIFAGFFGSGVHLKATLDGASGSVGAIQMTTFINVTAHRPTGATSAGQNSLRIEGGCGQIDFYDCIFDGVTNDTGTNVFVGTTGSQAPYSIHFHNCTNQNGFAYLIDGGTSITTENDHFENIKGCYNLANTSQLFVGLNFKTPHINTNVGVNAGNGYIINVPNTVVNGDVTLDHPFMGVSPDHLVINNAGNNCSVSVIDPRAFNSSTPVNTYVSSGISGTLAPAATVDLKSWTTVQATASATSMTTFKSNLMPGQSVTLYATGGTIQFGTGGNIALGPYTSPMIIPSGGSATFMRVDAGTPVFVLLSATIIPTVTLKKGSGGGNYSSASTTYVVMDSTNLCYTVTIPVGWKLLISAVAEMNTATVAVTFFFAITDNAACGTANAGVIAETSAASTGTGTDLSVALTTVITGDGASHSIALQYKTSNALDSATVVNSSASRTPMMTFLLTPSS